MNQELIAYESALRQRLVVRRDQSTPVPKHICASTSKRLRHYPGKEEYFDYAKYVTQFHEAVEVGPCTRAAVSASGDVCVPAGKENRGAASSQAHEAGQRRASATPDNVID
jgi:hypothetical protein